MNMVNRAVRGLLGVLLVGAFVASLVGTAIVWWQAPRAALWIFGGVFAGVAVLCALMRDIHWGYALLAAILAVFGCGLYWLHLLGASSDTVGIVLGALVGVPLALMATGSGEPYED